MAPKRSEVLEVRQVQTFPSLSRRSVVIVNWLIVLMCLASVSQPAARSASRHTDSDEYLT